MDKEITRATERWAHKIRTMAKNSGLFESVKTENIHRKNQRRSVERPNESMPFVASSHKQVISVRIFISNITEKGYCYNINQANDGHMGNCKAITNFPDVITMSGYLCDFTSIDVIARRRSKHCSNSDYLGQQMLTGTVRVCQHQGSQRVCRFIIQIL